MIACVVDARAHDTRHSGGWAGDFDEGGGRYFGRRQMPVPETPFLSTAKLPCPAQQQQFCVPKARRTKPCEVASPSTEYERMYESMYKC